MDRLVWEIQQAAQQAQLKFVLEDGLVEVEFVRSCEWAGELWEVGDRVSVIPRKAAALIRRGWADYPDIAADLATAWAKQPFRLEEPS